MLTLLNLKLDNIIIWIWLAVFIGTIIFELATVELNAIWFVIGSLVALLLAIIGLSPILQISVFFLTSFILLLSLGKYARKAINKSGQPTNIDSFIGKEIIVLKEASHLEMGCGKINGATWTICCDEGKEVSKGDLAIITKIQGNKLIVEKKHN